VRLSQGDTRFDHSLVNLPRRGVLAFGGAEMRSGEATTKDDVHLLDLTGSASGAWTELMPGGSGPGERAEHAAVMRPGDGVNDRMVTYGGVDSFGNGGGTFTWQSPLAAGGPVEAPAPRSVAALAVERDAHILDLGPTGDGTWSRVTQQGQARAGHAAVYDPVGDAMVVFGGRRDDSEASAENSTWRLTLGGTPAWEALSGGSPPSKRFSHSAVYDAAGKRMIVFGGTDDWKSGMNDTYALDLSGDWANASWTRLSPAGNSPGQRYDHGAVYLPDLAWMVVFGGTRDGRSQLNDIFALDLTVDPPRWQALNVEGTRPAAAMSLGAAYADVGSQAVFYGGLSGTGNSRNSRREAWGLKCAAPGPTVTPTASQAPDTPTPTATEAPVDVTLTGLVYDAVAGMGSPVAGATVAVSFSLPHQPVSAITGADGRYQLLVPAAYVLSANQFSVTAAGYQTHSVPVTGAELAANPNRDVGLDPAAPTVTPTATESPTPVTPTVTATPEKFNVYAPIVVKNHTFLRR
jgi:hypothetical protein